MALTVFFQWLFWLWMGFWPVLAWNKCWNCLFVFFSRHSFFFSFAHGQYEANEDANSFPYNDIHIHFSRFCFSIYIFVLPVLKRCIRVLCVCFCMYIHIDCECAFTFGYKYGTSMCAPFYPQWNLNETDVTLVPTTIFFSWLIHYCEPFVIINLVIIFVIKWNKKGNEIVWMKWLNKTRISDDVHFAMWDLVLPTNSQWNCENYMFS